MENESSLQQVHTLILRLPYFQNQVYLYYIRSDTKPYKNENVTHIGNLFCKHLCNCTIS